MAWNQAFKVFRLLKKSSLPEKMKSAERYLILNRKCFARKISAIGNLKIISHQNRFLALLTIFHDMQVTVLCYCIFLKKTFQGMPIGRPFYFQNHYCILKSNYKHKLWSLFYKAKYNRLKWLWWSYYFNCFICSIAVKGDCIMRKIDSDRLQ